MKLKAREGDFIETAEGLIFDVKGLVHPPNRVIAFVRYLPDPSGDRIRDGLRYLKVYPLADRYNLLDKWYPHYLFVDPVFNERLIEVPLSAIVRHYKPQDKLVELQTKSPLDDVELQTLDFIKILKESSKVSWEKFGVSGSVLLGLHTQASDIDPIVYGTKNCISVNEALAKLLAEKESQVKPYNLEGLKRLYEFRSGDTIMPFKDFVWHEGRKLFQGLFRGRDYFVRYVKDWDEVTEQYGDVIYKPIGYVKIRAEVMDDSESIFTPCCYEIDNVKIIKGKGMAPIKKIVSYRGRFCQHAKAGETIVAQGKLEKVSGDEEEYYQLLLGSKPSDYMFTIIPSRLKSNSDLL